VRASQLARQRPSLVLGARVVRPRRWPPAPRDVAASAGEMSRDQALDVLHSQDASPQALEAAHAALGARTKIQTATVSKTNEHGREHVIHHGRRVSIPEYDRARSRPLLVAFGVVLARQRPRRLDRRLGCGRPPSRRTSRATRAGPDSDPDLAEPPRAHALRGGAWA